MLSSDLFLSFYKCPNRHLLASLLQSNATLMFLCRRYALTEPNYGPLMFRCKEFLTFKGSKDNLEFIICRCFIVPLVCVRWKLHQMLHYITRHFCVVQMRLNKNRTSQYRFLLFSLHIVWERVLRLGLNQIICTPTDLLPLHMLVLFRLSTVLLVWIVALFVRNLIFNFPYSRNEYFSWTHVWTTERGWR